MSTGRIVVANDEEGVLKAIVDRLEHYGFEGSRPGTVGSAWNWSPGTSWTWCDWAC